MGASEKVLIITYYWPPAGGSGVQRWMYFARYLPDNGITPYVVTVDENKASYKFTDPSFLKHVEGIEVHKTSTREPLKLYSRLTTGKADQGIPIAFSGEDKPGLFKKFSRYIRGNFFIPDARVGWNKFAYAQAKKLIQQYNITKVITTGPPHSTHFVGLKLKKEFGVKWLADFRDPWGELFYNKLLYRTKKSIAKDAKMEMDVLTNADVVLTVGPSMQKLLQGKLKENKSKVKFIYNGFDSDVFTSLKRIPDASHFVITHIGILSESQPVDAFVDGLKKIFEGQPQLSEKIIFRVVGNVSPAILGQVRKELPQLKVETIAYVPHQDALQYMMNSNLLFNSLANTENSKYLISGKLMEYLATGNPVFCLGDPQGDAAGLLSGYAHCKVFAREDITGITMYLQENLNAWKEGKQLSHSTSELPFSRKNTAKELSELLRQL